MAELDLNESAWQRAKRDAEGIYRTTTFGVALAIMELLAVPVAVLATVNHHDTATQVTVPILSGALALALAFGVILVVQLAIAPVRQRDELRRNWVQSEPVKPVNIELTLRNERRKANGFYSVHNGAMVTTTEDQKGAEEWTNRVVDLLSEYVDADAAREFIEAPKNLTGLRRQLQAQTRVLDQIIERISSKSNP